MTNYYSNSVDYHDALDRFEAQERHEQAMRDFDAKQAAAKEEAGCCCYEHIGDNPNCRIHGDEFTQADEQERQELYTLGMGA